ncbi:sensor histidine kinase [Flavobacterium sp. SUN052]|uniref:sensor histidine kinase n=1 Tax=Flavobacterium sp. SUN052 TaxID=3002441 RepID=UPI002DB73B36|nr:ATP-binding protein [Flavobacterium sp. SUN052]
MIIYHQHEEHQKELLSTQIEIQNQTMQHIGREIHDNIGQKLTLASLYTQQLAFENKAPQINESIENISAIINQSLSELRELSKSLTDDTINDSTIVELLKRESDKINDLKKCKVSFDFNDDKLELNYQMKSVLLRISQEFMQNSIKHSKCKNIKIDLDKFENKLKLTLADDGVGFDISTISSKGIGLSNMKKRTEIIGGNYKLESVAKKGTHLTITIPI